MRTRLKLDIRVDYSEYEYEAPCIKTLRIKKDQFHHSNHGWPHEEYLSMNRTLRGSVGQVWDDVYSKLRERYDHRSKLGWRMVKTLHSIMKVSPWGLYRGTFYRDEGILRQYSEERRQQKVINPVTEIKYNDDTWFIKEELYRPAICGCAVPHYRVRVKEGENYWDWDVKNRAETCAHGNTRQSRCVWFVKKTRLHSPDEVYKIYSEKHLTTGVYTEHKVYYNDVPASYNLPVTISHKTANKKELAIIRQMGGIV